MTTYNTGNPIGSTDPKDLYDNAQNLDALVNSTTELSHADRLAVQRKTWRGMEVEFDADQAERAGEFAQFLADSAYQDLGVYGAGIEVTRYNQVFLKDGEFYRASASLGLPYTTTGLWASESGSFVGVGDAVLRQDLDAPGGAALVGFQQYGTGAVATTVQEALRRTVSVFDFMTAAQVADVKAGTLAVDVTNAVIAAFSYANSFAYTGLSSSIFHPGCDLVFEEGRYSLSTLTDKIYVKCNVQNNGASFVVPAEYSGEVLRVGYDEAGKQLNSAEINLPNVYKPNASSIVAGSVGVRLANINDSRIYFGRLNYFETGVWIGGIGEGTVYCSIFLGQMSYNKRQIYIVPGPGGWSNANNVYNGNLYQGPIGSIRLPGYYQLYMDGSSPATSVVGNNFYNLSLEGPSSEYLIYAKNAYGNTFFGGYHESGISPVNVTVSGDTLTVASASDRPSIGDKVALFASVPPTGMVENKDYYVVAAPTSTTFKVALDSGNTAGETFSSAGTNVRFRLLCRLYFEAGAGENTFDNQFVNWFTPPTYGLQVIQNGRGYALNNALQYADQQVAEAYDLSNMPMYRGVNTATPATVRPIFAAYPPTVDPSTDPHYWSTALGDRGVLFAESGSETGRIFNSAGIVQYRRPADSASYEIASCRRSPSIITVTSLSCAANSATITDVTVTGANVNDHVLVTPLGLLTAGMVYSHSYVTSSNTVRVVFYNPTASPISLSTTLQIMVVRRFY